MPLSTDFSNKSAACGVRAESSSAITGTLTALALPLSPPPSPLDSCSVIRMGLVLGRRGKRGGIEFGAVRIAYPVNQTVPSTDYFVFVVFEFFFSSSSSFSWLVGEGRFRGIGTSTITFQFRLTRRGKILPFSSLNIHSLRKKLLLAIFARLRDLFKW